MTRGMRKLAAVLAALGAAGALAACGSGGDDSVSPDAIAEAASATGSIQGAAVDLHATMKAGPLGDHALTFTGAGVQDTRHKATQMTLDMSALAQTAGASGASPNDLKLDAIYVNQHMYMHSPLVASQLPNGKTWIGMDMRRTLQSRGVDTSTLTQGNPTDMLRYLRAASGGVTRVGREDVRGVETTHYKATIDLRKTPKLDRRSAERLIAMGSPTTMPIEVWVDGRKLVRRMRMQFSMKLPPNAGAAAGQKIDMAETLELYNFGPKPRIQPPPARDVYDATDFAAKGVPGP